MLWEKPYKWEKYTLSERERLGYLTARPSEYFLNERFSDFCYFEVEETVYGTFKVTAVRRTKIVIVSSPNRNAYPDNGVKEGCFYKFLGQ